MRYIILHNPLSKRGKNIKIVNKIEKRLRKNNHEVEVGSILEVKDVSSYIDSLNPEDKIIVVGGDGTLHYLANQLQDYEIKNDIFVVRKAGTGNDFVRSIKTRDHLIRINDYLVNLPYDVVKENAGQKRYFLNSIGIGLDAYVANLVNESGDRKGKWTYFKSVIKTFIKFKPFQLTAKYNGEEETFKKAWFAVVANSPYFGSGMKVSPKSERFDDKIELVVVSGVNKLGLFLIFPFIYLGWHTIFKRWVKIVSAKEINIVCEQDQYVQYDGETFYPRRLIDVYRT
ncbi:MAG: hypothetical protein GX149_03230 [Acholeplasmataceae bacterium]|jgi:YegS/Rv2252/BmrU family lipid kinase|nr:hypothetical protein [Acholeplasmataceae bacterium]